MLKSLTFQISDTLILQNVQLGLSSTAVGVSTSAYRCSAEQRKTLILYRLSKVGTKKGTKIPGIKKFVTRSSAI
jgi:hypothetical protein